jgi:hypothetical protein
MRNGPSRCIGSPDVAKFVIGPRFGPDPVCSIRVRRHDSLRSHTTRGPLKSQDIAEDESRKGRRQKLERLFRPFLPRQKVDEGALVQLSGFCHVLHRTVLLSYFGGLKRAWPVRCRVGVVPGVSRRAGASRRGRGRAGARQTSSRGLPGGEYRLAARRLPPEIKARPRAPTLIFPRRWRLRRNGSGARQRLKCVQHLGTGKGHGGEARE